MKVEKMKKTTLIGFTLLFVIAGRVFGAPDWCTVKISPDYPGSTDVVAITLSGEWSNSCIPNGSAVSVVGNGIYFLVMISISTGYYLLDGSYWMDSDRIRSSLIRWNILRFMLRIFPFGTTPPKASLVNYKTGVQNIANSTAIKTCLNCDKDISIQSNFGTAHVAIDVLGYYFRATEP